MHSYLNTGLLLSIRFLRPFGTSKHVIADWLIRESLRLPSQETRLEAISALVLLSIAFAESSKGGIAPAGAVVFSPITDLALTGKSFDTRAEVELYVTKPQAAGLVRSDLGETDPKNPLASPLYGDLRGLPPIRVHVGNDEVLLDDSRRYVERAVEAGVDAKLDVWMGMPHGFVANVGGFDAATLALEASGAFLIERLGSMAGTSTNNQSRRDDNDY